MALLSRANWKDVSTALSGGSIFLASFGAAFPDPWSKAVLAASVGMANAAVLAYKHGDPKDETQP